MNSIHLGGNRGPLSLGFLCDCRSGLRPPFFAVVCMAIGVLAGMCFCVCMYVCTWVSSSMCAQVTWKPETDARNLPQSLIYSSRQGLSVELTVWKKANQLTSWPWGSLFCLWSLDFRWVVMPTCNCVDAGDLKSKPHVCVVPAFHTSMSPSL